jgi:hypothetical protein
MMDASDPFANENATTPTIITIEKNILSRLLVPEMSPYPTVVMVLTVR